MENINKKEQIKTVEQQEKSETENESTKQEKAIQEKQEPQQKKQKQEHKEKKLVQPTISQALKEPSAILWNDPLEEYDALFRSIGSELYYMELKSNYICLEKPQRGIFFFI